MTDLLSRWMSSIAMDSAGDMAIGYSTSSSASFPSIAYAGRLAGDTLNTLSQGETQLFAGTGPQRHRTEQPPGSAMDFTQRFDDWLDDAVHVDRGRLHAKGPG